MIKNIAIIGFKREQAYEVAKLLAEQFDMSLLDTVELFEFDNAPRTQSSMIEEFGMRVYRKKFRSTVKYSSFFENTVINVDPSVAYSNGIFEILKKNCLLIYLNNGTKRIYNYLNKQQYKTKQLKQLYKLSLADVEKRAKRMHDNADITIYATGASEFKISSEIIRHIKEFYGVN